MNASQRLLWTIYAGVVGTVTTLVAQKAVYAAWKGVTGEDPPDPNDPDTPLNEAVIWALAGGVGIGVTQMLMNRFAAKRWEKSMGTPAPGLSKVKVKL